MMLKTYPLKFIVSIVILLTAGYLMKNGWHQQSTQPLFKQTIHEEENEAYKKSLQIDRAAHDFQMLRNPKTNTIPKLAATEAYKAAFRANNTSKSQTLPTVGIETRGPGNFGGRVRALAFDSRNPMIGLSGGVSGGIFRTADGGNTWTNVTPPGQIHNLTTLAQDQSSGNEDIWYAGGGEQIGNSASGSGAVYHGNGIWKSTDNGLTWTLLPSTTGDLETFDSDWDFIHRIIVDPSNGNIYAGNAGGVYRSTNQGVDWTQVLAAQNPSSETVTDIIRSSNGVFYAVIGGEALYSSPSGGMGSWASFLTLSSSVNRIVLAVAPSNPNLVFLLATGPTYSCGNGSNTNMFFRRFLRNQATGLVSETGLYGPAISVCANPDLELDAQGGYNLAIAVRPNNENEVFIGGERLYRFTIINGATGTYEFAGGDQGNPTATNVHVDHHYLLFTDDNTLWSTNDGGIRSADVSVAPAPHSIDGDGHSNGGFNWTNRNNGLITYQFYHGDITPNVGSNMVGGGVQDNANIIIPQNTTNGTELGGADGTAFALISGTDETDFKAIIGIQNGTTFRRTNANTGFGDEITPENDAQPFKGFFLLDGDNTEHLYYPARDQQDGSSSSSLYRTRTASTVPQAPTGNAATGWQQMTLTGIAQGHDISTMGLSRNTAFSDNAYTASDGNRKLYIGTDQGLVYRTTDPAFANSLSLTNITPSGLTGFISDISVNPKDDKEVMVTVSNYDVSSIFHTTDATANPVVWTAIEGAATEAVAKASIRSAMITGGGLYMVGTSTGLYGTTTLSGATTVWERIGTNEIAYAVCVDMRLRTADNKIALATHGNGLFVLSPSSVPCNISALAIDGGSISQCQVGATSSSFTADVTVTFGNAPASGMLELTGDGTASVAISMLGSATSHTFTGVTMTADGGTIDLTATFSEDTDCTFNNSNAGTAPADCSSSNEPPTNLTATDFLPNSAKLDWTDNCIQSDSWEIEYGSEGFTQGSGTTTPVTTKPYTLTGLNQNIVYDYYVRSYCDGEATPTIWSEKLTFRTTPALEIFDASQIEGDNGSTTLDFTVLLSSAFPSDLRIAYHSQDFTATAGVDYQAVQDTLKIAAGSVAATISVTINGDETPELNEVFYLAASIVPFNNAAFSTIPVLEDGLALGYILDDDFEINSGGGISAIQSCGNEVVLNATATAGVQVGNWSVLHSSTTAGSFTSINSPSTIYTGNSGTMDSLVWTISVNNNILLQDTVIITISPDSDNDGVQDCVDLCLGGDDSQDADGDGSPDDCDCNANDPTDSFILVENPIDNSLYQSSNRLFSKGTVLDGTDVTFKAGQIITLTSGFEVQAGATFLAQISPCNNPSGAILEELPATARVNNTTVETPIVAAMELSIQPNPASHEALIQLTLAQSDNVRLTLFNQNGQQLKTLLSGKLIEGTNNYRLQVGYLPDGLYFIQAASAKNRKVQKLVVQR